MLVKRKQVTTRCIQAKSTQNVSSYKSELAEEMWTNTENRSSAQVFARGIPFYSCAEHLCMENCIDWENLLKTIREMRYKKEYIEYKKIHVCKQSFKWYISKVSSV